MSDKKILISGCGLSWSGQERKTWVNVFKSIGINVIDTSGPAVSNQWILNRAIEYVLSNHVDYIVIQLTNLGKLDVEVDSLRENELVKSDSLRNFTVDGIWPSSVSTEHPAKLLWQTFLFSPLLELQDINVKLRLLKFYCDANHIPLLILKGYNLPNSEFNNLIFNQTSLIEEYTNDDFYVYHDHTSHNTVPCIEFQFKIAQYVNSTLSLNVKEKLDKIQAQYWQKNH